ncbi:hypothetical protein WMY93_019260 [Mugilogobius chulae]|uniref:C-type lectin domain-containing protein n=1 Tax=Mugilogobius chulae TaxID=88201 RepID=A0AAW0NNJ0_9GOBI
MGLTLLIIIATAGLSMLKLQSATLEKRFTPIIKFVTFSAGQSYCRKDYDDLPTIENQQENEVFIAEALSSSYYAYYADSYAANSNYDISVWLGLYDDMNNWTWSLNEAAFDNNLNFNNWAQSEPQLSVVAKICVFMDPSGLWFDDLCTKILPAVCFYEPGPAQYILVTTPMTWDEAQLYCKSSYTDLVSVRDLTENGDVSTLLTTSTAWIGLYRQGWGQWSDQTPLTFNNFRQEDLALDQTSSVAVKCAVASIFSGLWKKVPYDPSTCPDDISSSPDDHSTSPDDPSTCPDDPSTCPDDPNTCPDDPNTCPDDHSTCQCYPQ